MHAGMQSRDTYAATVSAWNRDCSSRSFRKRVQTVKQFLSTDIMQATLLDMLPQCQPSVQNTHNCQPWSCGRCRQLIPWTAHLALHKCPVECSPTWNSQSMRDAGMVYAANGQHRCSVCCTPVGSSSHQCTAAVLRTVLVDFTATERGDTDLFRLDAQLSQARQACGLVAFVTAGACVPRTTACSNLSNSIPYLRMLVLVADSDMPNAGRGAFATSSIANNSIVCGYTGLRVADPNSPHDALQPLAWHTIRGIARDPTVQGGMAFVFNCGHHERACMLSTEGRLPHNRTPLMLLKASYNISAGTELLWDYNAVTDDPNDPLLHVYCQCGACEPGTGLVYYKPAV